MVSHLEGYQLIVYSNELKCKGWKWLQRQVYKLNLFLNITICQKGTRFTRDIYKIIIQTMGNVLLLLLVDGILLQSLVIIINIQYFIHQQ